MSEMNPETKGEAGTSRKRRLTLADFPPEKVQEAREDVAKFWEENAKAIREEDDYGPQIPEKTKDDNLVKGIAFAGEIRAGKQDHCFTIWQRIYEYLTGECVAFLP